MGLWVFVSIVVVVLCMLRLIHVAAVLIIGQADHPARAKKSALVSTKRTTNYMYGFINDIRII